MNTRKIAYIDSTEDTLQKEVDWAIRHSLQERFQIFCDHIVLNYLLAGIDVLNYPVKRVIYYIEDGEKSK